MLQTKTCHIPKDLVEAKEKLYDPAGFSFSSFLQDEVSGAYSACSFVLNSLNVKFRAAKITPKKVGQFVAIWKRGNDGLTQPYDVSDDVDLLVISVRQNKHFGQFIFSRSILLEKQVFSCDGKGGKRGMRVYPPWDEANNSQAKKTQQWQLDCFVDLSSGVNVDFEKSKSFLLLK